MRSPHKQEFQAGVVEDGWVVHRDELIVAKFVLQLLWQRRRMARYGRRALGRVLGRQDKVILVADVEVRL